MWAKAENVANGTHRFGSFAHSHEDLLEKVS